MGKILDKMIEWMNSPEGQEELEKERQKMQFIASLTDKWVEKFQGLGAEKRSEIIEKLMAKYDSDEYYWREIKRGYEPRCELYWFLDDYAEKYGEKMPNEEDNPFPHYKKLIDGKYVIRKMFGQGTVIQVWDVSKE